MFRRILNSYFFILLLNCLWFVANGHLMDDIAQNGTALNILEEMITRQKLLNDLDVIKNSIENLNLRYNTDETSNKDPVIFDIRIDNLPEKCQIVGTPSSCAEATACTKRSGYYHIKIEQFSNASFLVECDAHSAGGGWTVIQRRQDGSVDFFRLWSDYQVGFGDIEGEFFIGLDKLHALTTHLGTQELLIVMETLINDTEVKSAHAHYESFAIGDECDKYALKRIGRYSGSAGDSLQVQIGSKFSTKDQDNDKHATLHCAETYMGAWWYSACHWSNLNGHYGDTTHGKGINWRTWMGHTISLKYVKMMIRRRRY